MTVLGTRPEIIRLSQVIGVLDSNCEHILVHTGQNSQDSLSGVFFRELGVRKPNVDLGITAAGFGQQAGGILAKCETLMREQRPDRVLVLGDTNSGLSAIVARRLGIPVYHMEAGNRCYDFRVPEEVNRRLIDHVSTVLMPYTFRSKENLLHEGFAAESIFVTGNPIKQVVDHHAKKIESSDVMARLKLRTGQFFLVTMHRAENVDEEPRLRNLFEGLSALYEAYGFPVICSLHPRTRDRAQAFGFDLRKNQIRFLDPLGFFDFIHLEQRAFCLLSDSGTVQEEACIFRVPSVTIRDVTERPETIECGSNVLAGCEPSTILSAVRLVVARPPAWDPPIEYLARDVATTVGKIVLGYSRSSKTATTDSYNCVQSFTASR